MLTVPATASPIPSPDGPMGGVSSAAMTDESAMSVRKPIPLRGHTVVVLFALAWLTACASASPSASANASPVGSSEPAPPAACAALDLRTPSGDALALTGLWRSPDGGNYYLRQAGSCVWFTGLSPGTGAPGRLGVTGWTNVFLGTLHSDFTLQGEWADVPWGRDTGVGELTWNVDVAEVASQEAITLQVAEVTGGFGGQFLVRPEGRVDLHVRLQDTLNCVSVVGDDGTIYELLLVSPGWSIAEPMALFGPAEELIAPSEAFEVTGQLARGTGFCGPGMIIIDDSITVSP